MNKHRFANFMFKKATLAIFALSAVMLYSINPSNTKSWDPRARIFGFMMYRIPAGSMEPTIKAGDFIFASTYSYYSETPKRGDIVVFDYPHDTTQKYIKRIIGLAGDKITINGHQLLVNGEPQTEPHTQHNLSRKPRSGEWLVPAENLFVMGDNRDNSADSRAWGFVPTDNIVGRATYIWYSSNGETGTISRLIEEQ